MTPANVTILGCGCALPTYVNSPSCQIVSLCDKEFMIDCGEGAQLALRQMGLHTNRLYSIFISHLHGDHCFGVIGLLATLGMLKRSQPMHIYAHQDFHTLLQPLIDYHLRDCPYEIVFHDIHPRQHEVIFEARTVTVETIPLHHTVPCCGFLFTEHHRDQDPIKRYAYCSDTAYSEKIIPLLSGVKTLYHEATYLDEDAPRAKTYLHSTTSQAATMATQVGAEQLIIGHFSSRVTDQQQYLLESQKIFPNTLLAQERTVYTI